MVPSGHRWDLRALKTIVDVGSLAVNLTDGVGGLVIGIGNLPRLGRPHIEDLGRFISSHLRQTKRRTLGGYGWSPEGRCGRAGKASCGETSRTWSERYAEWSERYAEWCRLGVGCFDAMKLRRCRELESQKLLIIVIGTAKVD